MTKYCLIRMQINIYSNISERQNSKSICRYINEEIGYARHSACDTFSHAEIHKIGADRLCG